MLKIKDKLDEFQYIKDLDINIEEEFQSFSENNDGEKMGLMEKYLNLALVSEQPMQWVFLFLEIAHSDKSPCVTHEAVFNIGRIYVKHDLDQLLIDCAEYVANEFCEIVDSTNSMVLKHETMESMGDAGFNFPSVCNLLEKYAKHSNYDLANTARISYWQITGCGFGKDNNWDL